MVRSVDGDKDFVDVYKKRQYPAETMTAADYADDVSFLVNPLVQAKSLQHRSQQRVRSIGLYLWENKTEIMF